MSFSLKPESTYIIKARFSKHAYLFGIIKAVGLHGVLMYRVHVLYFFDKMLRKVINNEAGFLG